MLFVPYSSIIEMMLWRIPVRIEATTIAAMTPITIPRTVRKLRNLLARTLSSAIASVSRGKILGSLSCILELSFAIAFLLPLPLGEGWGEGFRRFHSYALPPTPPQRHQHKPHPTTPLS